MLDDWNAMSDWVAQFSSSVRVSGSVTWKATAWTMMPAALAFEQARASRSFILPTTVPLLVEVVPRCPSEI